HARKRARLARYGAIAAFFGVCAAAGAIATRTFQSAAAPAASVEKNTPSPLPLPSATARTAETKPPAPVPPVVAGTPGATETTGAKTKARVKTAAIRQGRNGTAGQTTGPRPTVGS